MGIWKDFLLMEEEALTFELKYFVLMKKPLVSVYSSMNLDV